MTNFALNRHTPPEDGIPRTRFALAAATGTPPDEVNEVTATLAVIATYIPSEILALYVAVYAAIVDPETPTMSHVWRIFIAFLIATPVVVWLVYAAKVRSGNNQLPIQPGQWPLWEMIAGTIAYVAWAVSLPDARILSELDVPTSIAAVLVLVVSTVLGLLSPFFQRCRVKLLSKY